MPQEMEIEILPDGETKVHIKGIKEKKCIEYVEIFKKLIGKLKSQKLTSEYYEPETSINIESKRL
ncbi:MAG: DUF2997 domain-containing protein [Elusimicrobiota bacterium]